MADLIIVQIVCMRFGVLTFVTGLYCLNGYFVTSLYLFLVELL
jgi:hypothetical protein